MQSVSRSGRSRLKKQDGIIIAVFFVLLTGLIFSSRLTGRPPVIESLNKKVCMPGEIVSIYGNYFGKTRGNSRIQVSGKSFSIKYQEWGPRKISFIVPDDMHSGLVSVITDRGESKDLVLLLNQKDIPEIVAGPSKPGEPYITDISPAKGTPGSVITISGLNFGQNRTDSMAYFTWISQGSESADKEDIFASLIPALENDFDLISWSDRELKIRIPDGASPGPVLVSTDKGISSPLYLEVLEPIGKKDYESRCTYQVSYTINIKNINSEQGNGLYLWLPRIANTPEQREIKIMYSDPVPLLANYKGLMQFYFEDLLPGSRYQVKIRFLFHRYAVRTRIANSNKISTKKEISQAYLGEYIQEEDLIPSEDPGIKKAAAKIRNSITKRLQSNPYFQAKAAYDYIIKTFNFSDYRLTRKTDMTEWINASPPEGNSLDYSLVFCTLLRHWGIPARPIGGYLVNADKKSKAHVWAEFYIENLGWIPVDPVLGSGEMPISLPLQDAPADFYFGSLDNQHITLSKGVIDISQMNPRGKVITSIKSPSLQTVYEESIGMLYSYSSEWSSLEDIGVY